MVVQGQPNTLAVTLEEMTYHTRAVARVNPRAQVVADMPFLSYQVSPEDALRAAGVLVKQGAAEAVKLEGGKRSVEAVRRIVEAGIPVMGHLGLTPQSVLGMGGFRVQGKGDDEERRLLDDALALQDAGVYSMVLEGLPQDVGARLSAAVEVPTIGIGAGPGCDGQVLVCYDLLGLYSDLKPKFVKRYAELGSAVKSAVQCYADEIRAGTFPGPEHSFAAKNRERTATGADPTGQTPIVAPQPPVYGPDTRED
jgi:3-methyl-2-oxobutanoate hydroxymethyltransferase